MPKDNPCCKNCHWAKWNTNKLLNGVCTFVVKWPVLPSAALPPDNGRIGIWPLGGKTCPCFKPKKQNHGPRRTQNHTQKPGK